MNKNKSKSLITIFEYQKLKVGEQYNGAQFTNNHLEALERFYGNGVLYFNLIHQGVKFSSYVGVLKVGNLTIEILPKADKKEKEGEEKYWRKTLIGMLRSVGAFNIQAPSSSSLQLKSNFILDLYFELFIKEVEYLYNKGLIKKYRKVERNSLALKGSILFGKHIQQNIVHQERFYVRQNTYDTSHHLHQIIYKTILLLQQINTNIALNSRIGSLLLNFPEMKNIKVTEGSFSKIVYNRKTESYKNAIEIARLLLLNYHSDLSSGRNNVLALMFDMNYLWEKFIYVSLRKRLQKGMSISAQSSKSFWQSEGGDVSSIRPDIVIKYDDKRKDVVLDTKWKNIGNSNPSPDDLRQLYAYLHYYNADRVALVYPGEGGGKGKYYKLDKEEVSEKECSVIKITSGKDITIWQKNIAEQLLENG